MKTKFNIILYAMIVLTALSCSASKSAMAQSDQGGYYENNGSSNDQGNDPNNNNADAYNNDNNGNYQDGNNDNYSDDQPTQDVTITTFNDALSPYGSWINDATYGRVWVCNVQGFRPYYSGGHWVYTEYGWTWVSDYAWGWAPFHYGRWAFDVAEGWMWVPGYQWGPAWVGWRSGGAYYGWAPLAPGIRIGIGLGGYGYIPAERWAFVQRGYLGSPYLGRYFEGGYRNNEIFRSTTVINNTNIYNRTAYVTGPNRAEVERYTGRSIQAARIANAARPGATIASANTVNMYRGAVRSSVAVNRTATINRIVNNSFNQYAAVQQHYNTTQQHINATANNYGSYRNYRQSNIGARQQKTMADNRNVQAQHDANSYQRNTPVTGNYNYSRSAASYHAPLAQARSYSPAPRQQSVSARSYSGGSRSYASVSPSSAASHSSGGGRSRR